MSSGLAIFLITFGLASTPVASASATGSQAEQVSAVDKALAMHCPDAQSEEVVECARQITAEVDKGIKRDLCAYRARTCAAAFRSFVARRDELIVALESAIDERSVVAQIEVALFGLQTTLAFEHSGAFKQRHDLEKQGAR